MKTLRVLWIGFLALFARKVKEDPIARLERIVRLAKAGNTATLMFKDVQLGEVRLAMYQTLAQPTALEQAKARTPEDIIREQGITETVRSVRNGLDSLVDDFLDQMIRPGHVRKG